MLLVSDDAYGILSNHDFFKAQNTHTHLAAAYPEVKTEFVRTASFPRVTTRTYSSNDLLIPKDEVKQMLHKGGFLTCQVYIK
jgi:hypothetical protein